MSLSDTPQTEPLPNPPDIAEVPYPVPETSLSILPAPQPTSSFLPWPILPASHPQATPMLHLISLPSQILRILIQGIVGWVCLNIPSIYTPQTPDLPTKSRLSPSNPYLTSRTNMFNTSSLLPQTALSISDIEQWNNPHALISSQKSKQHKRSSSISHPKFTTQNFKE